MNKYKLIDILTRNDIKVIEVEDYRGNTILSINLKDFDIADVEIGDNGDILRLQLNEESMQDE